jgi:formylglycine-generating enzyme required for sulfatase activity
MKTQLEGFLLETYTNSIGMEMVLIPAGSFMMGSEAGYGNEEPVHEVTISKPFYLGKHEVTQEQWEVVMGNNPSRFKGGDNPVENVSWNDVQAFIKKLNEKEGTTGYRLPTEAEWEYAARAGTNTTYFFGDDEKELSRCAWYYDNSGKKTHPVGQKYPNVWGLYDVHGNVWEWVQDRYGEEYYAKSPGADPQGPSRGSRRVFRGGSWYDAAMFCRSTSRDYGSPGDRYERNGFRLAFSPSQ